jgi:hypothetical protein
MISLLFLNRIHQILELVGGHETIGHDDSPDTPLVCGLVPRSTNLTSIP